jgi:hypothetical protein
MGKEERPKEQKSDDVERVPRRASGRDDLDNGELQSDKPSMPGWPTWKRPE